MTAKTRENLIEAFWSLYGTKRLENITVKEIAQKAGYNRGTFYEYFSDVRDMLAQIENALIPNIDELPPINIPPKSIGMSIDLFLRLFERNRRFYSVLLGSNGDPAFPGKLKNAIKPLLKQALIGNSRTGETELDIILEYTLSAMIGVLSFWLGQENPMSAEKLMEIMSRLMAKGVIGTLVK